ncbi:AraC family transcriptional regulator [Pelagibius litoralis]|uniref:AraC family transcriptional regulator n=1 Tax=Pelagibius litoralis TaxID=374515 RepID=A0A967C1Z0_9PROT|nr:AraC family transcriptional regulator [Pelagibius litoralis]NIA67388.1 AraC family transcriptional regulator [Pelagibius litoralis]
MARQQQQANHCDLWGDTAIPGMLLMHADFTSHEFAPHVHDELVIAVTERGGAVFDSRGVSDQAEEGTVLVFNPGEPHAGRLGRSDRWRYRAFYLDQQALARISEGLEMPGAAGSAFLTNKLQDPELFSTLHRLHEASQGDTSQLAREAGFLDSMAALYSRHGSPRPAAGRLGNERSRIGRVAAYLETHYAEAVSLAQLSELAEMSAFHLVRSFKKERGLPPHVYLTQVRLQQARRFLAEGMSLAETASAVGFYDQSALNRHFKRVYGVTPGQYARALT